MAALQPPGSPIRAPPDRRPCAPPRGLSRLAAPFVGSLRQGIRDIFPPLGGATVHSCMNSQDVNVGNLVSLNIQVRR